MKTKIWEPSQHWLRQNQDKELKLLGPSKEGNIKRVKHNKHILYYSWSTHPLALNELLLCCGSAGLCPGLSLVRQDNPPEPSTTYHHYSPLLCLSPYFLLWFNQCWKFSLTISTVEPRVGCQHLQRGDFHCGACSPCLLSGGCLSGSLPWEANAPMLVTGWRAWVGLFWRAKCLKSGFWWKKLVLCNQTPTRSTSPHKSVSKRDHRGVPALRSRRPHSEIFNLKSSRLARSSKDNLQAECQAGSESPALSYLGFLVLVQSLTSRHKSHMWLFVLGPSGATQVLRGIYAWWCAQKQLQMKRHFMTDKNKGQHRLDFSLALAWENFFVKSDTVKLALRKLGHILFDTAQENKECQDCIHLKAWIIINKHSQVQKLGCYSQSNDWQRQRMLRIKKCLKPGNLIHTLYIYAIFKCHCGIFNTTLLIYHDPTKKAL